MLFLCGITDQRSYMLPLGRLSLPLYKRSLSDSQSESSRSNTGSGSSSAGRDTMSLIIQDHASVTNLVEMTRDERFRYVMVNYECQEVGEVCTVIQYTKLNKFYFQSMLCFLGILTPDFLL
jgi:hypothetical protein